MNSIIVRAFWDAEAGVWVASSEDVPGFVAECARFDDLPDKAAAIIRDLLEVNGYDGHLPELPVHVMAERLVRVATPAA